MSRTTIEKRLPEAAKALPRRYGQWTPRALFQNEAERASNLFGIPSLQEEAAVLECRTGSRGSVARQPGAADRP